MSFVVFGRVPVQVLSNGGKVTNYGPGVLYYRDETFVSSGVNDGSLSAGQSVSLTGAAWALSASTSAVDAIPDPPAQGGGTASVVISVNSMNADIASMVATDFAGDPNVKLYNADAVINKLSTHFGTDQIHLYGAPGEPNRGTGLVAQGLRDLVVGWL